MRILAIDTTGPRESVAIVADGVALGEVRLAAPDAHSRRVLPAVAFLVDSLGLRPTDLDAFAVAVGPGSFTGVRVGISTVQGLALATGRPCLGVSSLEALATRIRGQAPWLVAMVDAYRSEVFAAVYDRDGQPAGPPTVEALARLLARVPQGAAFIGDGAERYREDILAHDPGAAFPARGLFLAATVGTLAAPRLERGEGLTAGELRPLYLRDASIRPSAAAVPSATRG